MRYMKISRMMILPVILLAAALAGAQPAAAGLKSCAYLSRGGSGEILADGYAKAFSRKRACKRAQRRCLREAVRKGINLQRFPCKRETNPPPRWKTCIYVARDSNGYIVAFGKGRALKMSKACKRAKRRCRGKARLKGYNPNRCHRQ